MQSETLACVFFDGKWKLPSAILIITKVSLGIISEIFWFDWNYFFFPPTPVITPVLLYRSLGSLQPARTDRKAEPGCHQAGGASEG